jgi:endonuclease/exonuclease/phosphatase family metal-dependent hydrolase
MSVSGSRFAISESIWIASAEQSRLCYALPLGFALNMIVRWWGASQDPIFTDPFYNVVGLVGVLLVLGFGPLQNLVFEISQLKGGERGESGVPAQGGYLSAALFGLLFGFSLTVVSAPGTLARYVGLDPLNDWWTCLLVIFALLAGTATASKFRVGKDEQHLAILCTLTVVGTTALYYGTTQSNRFFQQNPAVLEEWAMEQYAGSPVFAFVCGGAVLSYCIGVWWPHVASWAYGVAPEMLNGESAAVFAMPSTTQPKSLGGRDLLSFVGLLSTVIGSVYTVCYPFVPGGFLLRDRMNVVLVGAAVGVSAMAYLVVKKLSASQRVDSRPERTTEPKIATWCAALAMLAVVVCTGRQVGFSEAPFAPYVENGRETANLTVALWTIHFSVDNYGVDSMSRLTDWIRKSGANVVGLLESDMQRVTNGNRDIVEYMAYHLGYRYTDFGPTTLDSTFGCALISRFPIVRSERMVLPSPMGELACLIHAWVEVLPGTIVHVYVGHWGNTEHVQDLVLQSDILGRLAMKYAGPSVFLGYLTTPVGYKNYYRMIQSDGDAEDDIMRVTNDPNVLQRDDGTKTLPDKENGHAIPRIPIVKRSSGLFRDVARDMLRGQNQLATQRIADSAHNEARNREPVHNDIATSYYWRVYALAEDLDDDSLVVDGTTMSDDLHRRTAKARKAAALVAKLEDNVADAQPVADAVQSKEFTAFVRLQKAAEIQAQRYTRGFHQGSAVNDVPEALKPAMRFLENSTDAKRPSAAVIYYFPNTGRVTQSHPRREYEDRYCQQMLYRSMPLIDWYRALDIDELSDTELQIGKFKIVGGAPRHP